MPGKCSITRLKEIHDVSKQLGYDAAAHQLGVTKETVRRKCREYVSYLNSDKVKRSILSKKTLLEQIADKYSPKELEAIANGKQAVKSEQSAKISFIGDCIKFGFFTDPHMGSVYFSENHFNAMVEEFKKENVDFIACAGDVTDGMTTNPMRGQIYELTHIGFDRQKEYAIEQLKKFDGIPFYTVDGNHDRWFNKLSGSTIVKEICKEVDNATYLGHDIADLIVKGVRIRLWHGEDASSYAVSYRVSKIVESLTGGDKPNILLCGHTHKQVSMIERNIHCFSGGALSGQSAWMKSKRLAAHVGFYIIEATICNGGVGKITSTWYPFFV